MEFIYILIIIILILLVLFCTIYFYFFTNKRYEKAAEKFGLSYKNHYFSQEIAGTYKGRQIKFTIPMDKAFLVGGCFGEITPKKISKQKNAQPTEKTKLIDGKIFYYPSLAGSYFNAYLSGIDDSHVEISLQELTKAAEIVEQGKPYYKE